MTELAALMQQSLRGNQQAYATLLKETTQVLRPYLSKRLANRNEVDDVLQEILLSIHKARHTYDGSRPYLPWMYAIAQYRLQDHFRELYADELQQAEDLSEFEEILSEPDNTPRFSYTDIQHAVEQLPEKTAQIIRLIHQDGYTAKEVAEKLNMTESAVKVAAHRAYKILREKLE